MAEETSEKQEYVPGPEEEEKVPEAVEESDEFEGPIEEMKPENEYDDEEDSEYYPNTESEKTEEQEDIEEESEQFAIQQQDSDFENDNAMPVPEMYESSDNEQPPPQFASTFGDSGFNLGGSDLIPPRRAEYIINVKSPNKVKKEENEPPSASQFNLEANLKSSSKKQISPKKSAAKSSAKKVSVSKQFIQPESSSSDSESDENEPVQEKIPSRI